MVREYMKSLGFSDKDIDKIMKSYRISIYREESLYNRIKENYNYLLSVGYKHEDILKMARVHPIIFSYSIENIEHKMKEMINLGYTKEELLQMITQLPVLLGYSIENIREKKRFYDSIGLGEIVVKDSKRLMQSVELSYARYVFFRTVGIKVTMRNYKLLFVSEQKLIRRYGKNNKTLMAIYNYDEYLKRKNDKARKRLVK